MLNFTVGPVQMQEEIREIGREEIPYFRTPEFSALMLENERMMLEFMNAPQGARAVFLTGSGTAAMEAAVMNLFDEGDKLLVINGGSFGHRFTEICDVHGIAYAEIVPEFGSSVTEEQLLPYEGHGYTGLLVNLHETSVGVLYDIHYVKQAEVGLVAALLNNGTDGVFFGAIGIVESHLGNVGMGSADLYGGGVLSELAVQL